MLNPFVYQPSLLLHQSGPYTVEWCRNWMDLEDAFRLRHDAYVQAGSLAPRDNGLFEDEWDHQSHVQVYLIRKHGQPIGTIRNMEYSARFQWRDTSLSQWYDSDIRQALGDRQAFFEIGRLAISPNLSEADSLFAKGAVFMLQSMRSRLGDVTASVIGVSAHHASFFARNWGYEIIREQVPSDLGYLGTLMKGPAPMFPRWKYAMESFLGTDEARLLALMRQALNILEPTSAVAHAA